MNVHISYKVRKTPRIEREIEHVVEKLQKRLQVFRPELVHLKGVVGEASRREGVSVALNLHLPSGQMASRKSAATAAPAIKAALDDLLLQITKHKDSLRSSRKWPRWRGVAWERREPGVRFEDTFAAVRPETISADDVRSYVNFNLARLQRFVQRELLFQEAAEQVPRDCVSMEEVIDEAIALALGDSGEKPERLALEPWLYRLTIVAIRDLAARAQEGNGAVVHLEDSTRRPNVRASDEAELQFHQPDEMFTEETVIADRRVATPEDIAASDEMVVLVQYALGTAARKDREAFILHAIEGFTVEEIAVITNRPPGQVAESIARAREHLRRSGAFAQRPAKAAS